MFPFTLSICNAQCYPSFGDKTKKPNRDFTEQGFASSERLTVIRPLCLEWFFLACRPEKAARFCFPGWLSMRGFRANARPISPGRA